jgi:hypothetical protein
MTRLGEVVDPRSGRVGTHFELEVNAVEATAAWFAGGRCATMIDAIELLEALLGAAPVEPQVACSVVRAMRVPLLRCECL